MNQFQTMMNKLPEMSYDKHVHVWKLLNKLNISGDIIDPNQKFEIEQGLKIVFSLIEKKVKDDCEYLTKMKNNLNSMTMIEMDLYLKTIEKMWKRYNKYIIVNSLMN